MITSGTCLYFSCISENSLRKVRVYMIREQYRTADISLSFQALEQKIRCS